MREGKRYSAVTKRDEPPKFGRKTAKSNSKKTNGVERNAARRPTKFKSDSWYEKAALSMAVRRQTDLEQHRHD